MTTANYTINMLDPSRVDKTSITATYTISMLGPSRVGKTSIIASVFNFAKAEFFAASEQEKQAPNVSELFKK